MPETDPTAALHPDFLAQHDLRLGRPFGIACGEQQLRALRKQLTARSGCTKTCAPEPEEKFGRRAARPQIERRRVEPFRGRERAKSERPVSGLAEGSTRTDVEVVVRLTRSGCEVERPEVVVRDRFGVVFRSAERLDPLGCA